MGETKYTPGPWRVRSDKHDSWGVVRGADGFPVAQCDVGGRGWMLRREDTLPKWGTPEWEAGPPEVAANTALVSAAPDLLEALKALVDRAKVELADPEDVHEIAMADAAIAKAEGR